MKVIMYGAEICQGCQEAKKTLMNNKDIILDYRNITLSTTLLKEFLHYRDHESLFEEVKESGRIGIPFFILEDGTKTFEVPNDVVVTDSVKEDEVVVNACSIDGKGNC